MWIVLSEPFDPTGAWLASGLGGFVTEEVWHLTSRDINDAAQTDRAVDDQGVWFNVVLADGRRIESRRLKGVVNRLCSPATMLVPSLGARRTAGSPGFGAPLMRWLHRWPGPVLNRPNVDGLSGDFRPAFWWGDHAIRAGFVAAQGRAAGAGDRGAAEGETVDESRSVWVVVIDRQVISLDDPGRVVAASLATRCQRLAHATGSMILGIEAITGPTGDWRFIAASLRPDLVRGGDVVLRATAAALGMMRRGTGAERTSRADANTNTHHESR